MARVLPTLASQFIIYSLLCSFAITLITGEDQTSATTTMEEKLLGLKQQKLSHFRVFWHDIYSGKNPTAAMVVPPVSNTSSTMFGAVSVIDDPLTEGPELSSKLVGRAQGLYSAASQKEAALLMAMNFVFLEGKYNGSTITILGRNLVPLAVREMPVIGGSGVFRFARGYVQASTYKFDTVSGDATIEYNIYVLHY